MALSRVQTVVTYQTLSGGQEYLYDIVIDSSSALSVRNIRSPRGLVTDSLTNLPEVVMQDIQDAMEVVELQVAESQVATGTLSFTGQTSLTASISPGVLNNISYRVVYTTPDGIPLRTTNKTTTSFVAEAPSAYGSTGSPKSVSYAVYVSTAANSALGGVLTFAAADNSQRAVTFSSALSTDNYRVLLSPSDFFTAKITNKTKQGFTVVIGIGLSGSDTVTVGYDVVI